MENIQKHIIIFLLLFIILGSFFRFYNLNWGAPYYFHPDERNVASSVSQLQFPVQLNPKFFAYGSLPIYSTYLIGIIKNSIHYCVALHNPCLTTHLQSPNVLQTSAWQSISRVTFEDAIIILRFFSAIFSSLLILLVYHIGKIIHSKKVGLLAAFFSMTSVGLIQFAHFGTFEIWITFFSVFLFIVCHQILEKCTFKNVLLAGILTGILIAIKVSNIVLLPIPLICIASSLFAKAHFKNLRAVFRTIIKTSAYSLIITIMTVCSFLALNPYFIFDFTSFKSSMNYESGVALGTMEVFYSQEFFNTLPGVFQFLHVYPFLLNPMLTVIFLFSFLYVLWKTIRTKNKNYLLLILFYLLLFLTQAFLFVKWTRYMIPTLPFIYLICAIAVFGSLEKLKQKTTVKMAFVTTIIFVCCLFAFSYFAAVLLQPDTRINAAKWANAHTRTNSSAISEIYDLGIIPFNSIYSDITLCDFYNLETNSIPCNNRTLNNKISESKYIILPSERIMKTRVTNGKQFPRGSAFYKKLLRDKSEYQLIYKTPCPLFCEILYLGNPLFAYEQTASVFDRPTIYIFEIVHIQQ